MCRRYICRPVRSSRSQFIKLLQLFGWSEWWRANGLQLCFYSGRPNCWLIYNCHQLDNIPCDDCRFNICIFNVRRQCNAGSIFFDYKSSNFRAVSWACSEFFTMQDRWCHFVYDSATRRWRTAVRWGALKKEAIIFGTIRSWGPILRTYGSECTYFKP